MKALSSTVLLLLSGLFAGCATSTAPETIRNFRTPEAKIHTSGQPTKAQFDALPAAGYTRVIHLRLPNEKGTGWEEDRAKEIGIEFVRLPIAGAKGLNRDNVARFAEELAKPTDGLTLVSCGSSNRVGAMFGLKANWLDGKSKDEALEIAKAHGVTRLTKALTGLLK